MRSVRAKIKLIVSVLMVLSFLFHHYILMHILNIHNMTINQCDKHVILYSTLVDKGITQGFKMDVERT